MAPDSVPPVYRISPAALLVLLLAFALRVYRLDAQSLWYDEGLSVHLAALPLQQRSPLHHKAGFSFRGGLRLASHVAAPIPNPTSRVLLLDRY